jgi:hypothetical protein
VLAGIIQVKAAAAPAQPVVEQPAVAAAPASPVVQAPVIKDPEGQKPPEDVNVPGEGKTPDNPVVAAPPAAPSNLTLNYNISARRMELSWSPVNDPDLDRYLVKKWDQDDSDQLGVIFTQLVSLNPAAGPYLEDALTQIENLGQSGLTYTERLNILEALEVDLDALFGIMATTPGAEQLMASALALATESRTRNTYYNDWNFTANYYYFYIVMARNKSGEVSGLSNCEMAFSVVDNGSAPARPTGVTATAYDPGVGIQWSRNTETDLAGYNVYLVQGPSRTKLNTAGLITTGTAFFYDAGVAGAVYGVTAVDVANREGQIRTATATLAPATVYDVDNPAWQFTGQWVRENYTDSGGSVLQVAQNAGSRASITFTGRRVKVFTAYYWTCGDVRFYVDDFDYGTRSLYYPSTQWHMQPFVVTGLAQGQHTLTIEVVGSGGAEGYNFTNFDYVEVR